MLLMQDQPTTADPTTQTATVQYMGVSNSQENALQPSSLQAQEVDEQRSMFQMQMHHRNTLGHPDDDQSSPEASPERMAPQMEHLGDS